ncbi:MAG TPA: succinate dehydrogenase assembly factor 2 [Pseudomonadales bacterium]|nr:succinate dehydrogenase assembly factor 2 [Pseudomonadales bacterium]
MNIDEEMKRLRWHCRRGIKEVEVKLGPFFEHCYASLSDTKRETFQRLLECEDADLFDWVMQRDKPQDAALAELMDEIVAFHTQ